MADNRRGGGSGANSEPRMCDLAAPRCNRVLRNRPPLPLRITTSSHALADGLHGGLEQANLTGELFDGDVTRRVDECHAISAAASSGRIGRCDDLAGKTDWNQVGREVIEVSVRVQDRVTA